MGYTTDFTGGFRLSRTPTFDEYIYINMFSNSRRMARSTGGESGDVSELPDQLRENVGLPVGDQGEYCVNAELTCQSGQTTVRAVEARKQNQFQSGDEHLRVIGHNGPPANQPSLWCQWELHPSASGPADRSRTGVALPDFAMWRSNFEDTMEQARAFYESEKKSEWYLIWDQGEKFYEYVEWLEYMVRNFFEPWGIGLSGVVHWTGENPSDIGTIYVENYRVSTKPGMHLHTYEQMHSVPLSRLRQIRQVMIDTWNMINAITDFRYNNQKALASEMPYPFTPAGFHSLMHYVSDILKDHGDTFYRDDYYLMEEDESVEEA